MPSFLELAAECQVFTGLDARRDLFVEARDDNRDVWHALALSGEEVAAYPLYRRAVGSGSHWT